MTPEQRAAVADELVPGLRGKARDRWIQTGKGGREQANDARLERERKQAMASADRRSEAQKRVGNRPPSRHAPRPEPVDEAAADHANKVAAFAGRPMSQPVTPSIVAAVRAELAGIKLEAAEDLQRVLGITAEDLIVYVHGTGRLEAEQAAVLRDLTQQAAKRAGQQGSPRWRPRKVAAAVWGLLGTATTAA